MKFAVAEVAGHGAAAMLEQGVDAAANYIAERTELEPDEVAHLAIAGGTIIGGVVLGWSAVKNTVKDVPRAVDGIRRSMDSFRRDETGSVPDTRDPRDLDGVIADPNAPAGSPEHRAARWEEYQARDGQWDYDRWSTTYEQNQTRALQANAAVRSYQEQLGWGQTEVTVDVTINGTTTSRRLDIADLETQRAVEHKQGYTSRTEEIRSELERDAQLVRDGWEIEWSFDTEPSAPLREALDDVGINVTIRE